MQFEMYRDNVGQGLMAAAIGQWRWRLRASNGRIIANGGESFHNEADCKHSIALVQGTTVNTPIVRVQT